ncbi:MAG: hypothetical protein MUF34_14850, partial [Polyangiaceae bacterium]|nr:hypothetical protein [Polyangiaceae bacterium]
MGLALLNRSDALLALAAWAASAFASSAPALASSAPALASPAPALASSAPRAIVRARRFAIGLALALAPLGLYALWSKARFGHAASVSGAVKYGGLLYPPYAQRWWLPLLTAAALTLGAQALGRRAAGSPLRADAYRALGLLVSYAALQWALTYAARGEWVPDPWYLVPTLLALVVALSLALGREAGPGRAATLLAICGFALALAGWARRLDPGAYALADAYRRAALWLRASPAGAVRAAGWDCGVAGAHFDGRLSNLDGLVASWAYQESYLEPGRVGAFLDDAGIGAIVQHFGRSELDAAGSFVGVDLAQWRVAHAECVTLRLATRPWRREHRFVAVLVRGEAARGPRFDEAARGWRALERCPPPLGSPLPGPLGPDPACELLAVRRQAVYASTRCWHRAPGSTASSSSSSPERARRGRYGKRSTPSARGSPS